MPKHPPEFFESGELPRYGDTQSRYSSEHAAKVTDLIERIKSHKPGEKFEAFEKYDPNQPRDKDGKWTDVGQSNASVAERHKELAARSVKGPPMSAAEAAAVKDYTGAGADIINNGLRGSGIIDTESVYLERDLDGLLSRASLDEELTAYRFLSPAGLDRIEKQVGGTLRDKGYVSVTMNRDFFVHHTNKDPFVKIRLPKGAKALPIAHLSNIPGEREVLIHKNQTFKVTKEGLQVVLSL